jgi:serine/threonine-protein kinase HipA
MAGPRQLRHRLVFKLLITNVDDHLHKLGFLQVDQGRSALVPAFDQNPFPDKDRESKSPLTEETYVIASVDELMTHTDCFYLGKAQARQFVSEVVDPVDTCRTVNLEAQVAVTRGIESVCPGASRCADESIRSAFAAAACRLRARTRNVSDSS